MYFVTNHCCIRRCLGVLNIISKMVETCLISKCFKTEGVSFKPMSLIQAHPFGLAAISKMEKKKKRKSLQIKNWAFSLQKIKLLVLNWGTQVTRCPASFTLCVSFFISSYCKHAKITLHKVVLQPFYLILVIITYS